MKQYNRGDNMYHIDNLYDEIRVVREQLLNRIEILEDDVDYLSKENMYYSKEIYQLQNDINSLLAKISEKQSENERLEYQKNSKNLN